MKKIDKNGFALAEAIVVSVFVLGMFTYLAMNIIPLISKYDIVLNYDNPQEVYAANVLYDEVLNFLYNNADDYTESENTLFSYKGNMIFNSEADYIYIDGTENQKYFKELINYLDIIGTYNINESNNCSSIDANSYSDDFRGMRDYCNYLYSKKNLAEKQKQGEYSIYLIEFKNNKFSHFEVKAGDENA